MCRQHCKIWNFCFCLFGNIPEILQRKKIWHNRCCLVFSTTINIKRYKIKTWTDRQLVVWQLLNLQLPNWQLLNRHRVYWHLFDQHFDEWEQIQSNHRFGDWLMYVVWIGVDQIEIDWFMFLDLNRFMLIQWTQFFFINFRSNQA